MVRDRHGGGHLYLCGARWLCGLGLERLHPGHDHAHRYHCRYLRGVEWPGRYRNGYRESLADPGRGKRHGRTVHFDVRSRCAQLAWRYHPYFARHVGTPADGPEVLRHQDRSSHQAGCHHLDDLRARGCGWLVFLGWFRPLVRWRYRLCCQWHAYLRLDRADHACWAS